MDLYREEILDYYRNPRNKQVLENADAIVEETNASCGDDITLYLKFRPNGTIANASYTGQGCAISQASVSMLTELLPELGQEELNDLSLETIYNLLGGPVNTGRIKCAALGLRALEKGLVQYKSKQT